MCNEHLYHIHANDSKQYAWDIETAISSLILSRKYELEAMGQYAVC